jgi:hypothetical protein
MQEIERRGLLRLTATLALRLAGRMASVIARRRSRRSNPESAAQILDCFAALAMTSLRLGKSGYSIVAMIIRNCVDHGSQLESD